MSHGNVLEGIKCFLDQQSSESLKIIFDTLEIETYVKGNLLNRTIKQKAALHILSAERTGFAKMEVLDHLVFSFSLYFPYPESLDFYKTTKLKLPRPLANGSLKMDVEIVGLEFTIDAPEEELKVGVKHIYRNVR